MVRKIRERERESNNWLKLPKTCFTTVFANDIRPDAQALYNNYFPQINYHLGSIVDLVKIHQTGKTKFPQHVDVVTGGFPCQDFSVAGKRLGFLSDKSHTGKRLNNINSNENRGQLYLWMREVISITSPKIFIAENVKGLVNLKDAKETIEKDFCKAGGNGYLVVPVKVLHAADYGVPQARQRVFFIGFKKTALISTALHKLTEEKIDPDYDPYPIPTHTYNQNNSNLLLPTPTLKHIFQGLTEPDLSPDLSQQKYSKAKYMGTHCQGQTEVSLNGIAPTIRSEHHGNIEFRRLSLAHGGSNELKLPERRLSIRECARIQTFPDDYQFIIPGKVSASSAYKLIGNAVPPLLAYHLAIRIQERWVQYFGEYD